MRNILRKNKVLNISIDNGEKIWQNVIIAVGIFDDSLNLSVVYYYGGVFMSIDTLIQNLYDSPMFNLSLSSKELFHSNFLSFIFSKYNDLFCQITDTDNFDFEVKREHKDIDIEILGKNGNKYIIENKVKDILQQEQYDKISNLFIKDKYKKVILFSLLGDNLSFINNNQNWKEIGYTKIINCLKIYDFKNDYIAMIVKDYCFFVENMVNLFLESGLKNCDRYILYKKNVILNKLEKIRIYDIFLKYGMSLFINYFKKQYKDISVEFSIHRSMGAMSFYKINKGIKIGIQIEDSRYSRFSVCEEKALKKYEGSGWFDKNYRSPGNKKYLSFKDKGDMKFYYQIKDININDKEFKELSKIIYKDLSSI